MTKEIARSEAEWYIQNPKELGIALGYTGFTDMHGEWIKRMVGDTETPGGMDDMTLQAHRGSYKTTCLGVSIALMMIKYRDKNIMFLRKTDTDVAEVIKNVDRILNNPIFREICLALAEQELEIIRSTASEITTNWYCAPRGASQLLGMGISGSLTGKHADIVITDDIVNLKDRISQAEREHTKAVYQELQNVRNPGGRIINTGTPWHKEDAFMIMPKPDVWDYRRTGMLSDEKIKELRRQMSPSLFAANYELRHIAAEDALFSKAPEFFDDETMLEDGVAHIDAAYGGEDYTAFTCGKMVGNTLYMYGRMWHSHVDTVLDIIIAECDRLQCYPIHVEDNADKGFLRKEIRRKERYPHGYHEKENKYVKIASYLRKWWERIVWLDGTDPDYLGQIMDYTIQAEHDDAPDSAACVVRLFDKRYIQEEG